MAIIDRRNSVDLAVSVPPPPSLVLLRAHGLIISILPPDTKARVAAMPSLQRREAYPGTTPATDPWL